MKDEDKGQGNRNMEREFGGLKPKAMSDTHSRIYNDILEPPQPPHFEFINAQ